MIKNKKQKVAFMITMLIFSIFLFGCSSEYLIKKISKICSSYFIDITVNTEEHTASVNQKVIFKNNSGATLNSLKFNLYVKTYTQGATNKPVSSLNEQKAYPNGLSYGDIAFNFIKEEGKTTTYSLEEIDQNILNVALLKPLKPGYSSIIEMSYNLTIPNINHRFGYGNNTINLGNFYPSLCVIENNEFVVQPYSPNGDPFYSELANYVVNVTYPNSFTMANTGAKTKTEEVAEDKLKTTAHAKSVRDFCFVLSSKFETLEQMVGNTKVLYYYYNDEKNETSLNTIIDALNTFNNLIGKYPYTTLSVVKTNFVHGGMEYPNLVYVSDALDNYEDYTNVIIHELAHQWWYSVVGNNAYKNGWLDEGLTEYTTALFYKLNPDYNIKLEEIMENALSAYNMFQQVYSQIFGVVDTTLTRTLSDYRTEPEYVYMAYVKSMLLFYELHKLLGDDRFYSSLKNYYNEHRFKNVTPNDLIDSFEKHSHRKLKSWFNSWIDGKVIIKELN